MRLTRLWIPLRTHIGFDDLVFLIGLLLIAAGLWWIWWPIAILVPGLLLVWLTLPPRLPFILRREQDKADK